MARAKKNSTAGESPADTVAVEVVAYKGFDKNMQCRGFQFEVGKTYEQTGKIESCKNGFHACKHPLSVFGFYAPATSRFAEVRMSGEIDDKNSSDTKIAAARISIEAELSISELTKRAVQWVFDRAKWSEGPVATEDNEGATASGDQGAATASGYQGAATASGTRGAATASGYQGAATASGKLGCSVATGEDGRVRGEVDGIDLFAREIAWNGREYVRKSIACGTTGEDGIKAGTWYRCIGGKLVEVE